MKLLQLSIATAALAATTFAQAQSGSEGSEKKVYKTIGDIQLNMRIYKPEGWKAADSRPAIVFFFGGGWRNGTPQQFDPHCRHLAAKGMVAMAAEYRIQSKHESNPIDSTRDAKSAIRWVRQNAAKLGVDPKRIAAGGGSAGGHLAAATATIVEGVNEESDDLSISAVPNALTLFNPAVNLVIPVVADRWGDEVYAKISTISPIHHVTAKLPPTVIFHGTNDSAVAFKSVEAFVSKAKYVGATAITLHAYEGRPHGFFNHGRGDGKDYEDTVAKMDAFLKKLGWIE